MGDWGLPAFHTMYPGKLRLSPWSPDTGELQVHDACREPRPRPRRCGLPLARQSRFVTRRRFSIVVKMSPRRSGSAPWAPSRYSTLTPQCGAVYLFESKPVRPGGVKIQLRWRRRPDHWRDLSRDRSALPPRFPLSLLQAGAFRAKVIGVSSAHDKEVGEHLASPASRPGSTGPGPRGRCQEAPA